LSGVLDWRLLTVGCHDGGSAADVVRSKIGEEAWGEKTKWKVTYLNAEEIRGCVSTVTKGWMIYTWLEVMSGYTRQCWQQMSDTTSKSPCHIVHGKSDEHHGLGIILSDAEYAIHLDKHVQIWSYGLGTELWAVSKYRCTYFITSSFNSHTIIP
jgi:hypothetical protein